VSDPGSGTATISVHGVVAVPGERATGVIEIDLGPATVGPLPAIALLGPPPSPGRRRGRLDHLLMH
jgi:hypothetical protein